MSVSPLTRAAAIFTTVASAVCCAPEPPRSAKFNSRRDNPLRFPGDYTLNPTGHPHSAFIGSEVITLTICTGEPDEVRTIEVVPSEEDGATGS